MQRDYISKGGNFVAFEYYGKWYANIEGVFDFDELRHLSNLLKTPTSKSITNKIKVQKELFDG
jgi:hypothetical protein